MPYIMVIDDDRDSAEALCRYLRLAGHEARSLPNGKQALSSILSNIPDLIILDMSMPGMDGPSLLEVLRSYLRLATLPAVVLTGLPDGPLTERARHLNVSQILIKGKASLEDVLHAVEQELPRINPCEHAKNVQFPASPS